MRPKGVVITGASSGIGRAIAVHLASPSTRFCFIGRNRETLAGVAEQVCKRGAEANCYCADLAVEQEIREAASAILHDCPGVDVLVHSAGFFARAEVAESDSKDLDRHYRVNVRAPYLLTQHLLPSLREHRGQIVFVNSSAGLAARAGVSQYAASKHALKALADSLREEMNTAGVRVTNLFLGRTASPMQASVCATEGRPYRPELLMQPEDVAAVVATALALPRTAEITEISMRPLMKSY